LKTRLIAGADDAAQVSSGQPSLTRLTDWSSKLNQMGLFGCESPVRKAVFLDAWRGSQILFGHSLLERNLKLCRRAGVEYFVLECPPGRRGDLERALLEETRRDKLYIVDSASFLQQMSQDFGPGVPCLVVSGDVVFLGRDLRHLLEAYAQTPCCATELSVHGGKDTARFAAGPLAEVLTASEKIKRLPSASVTPFATDEPAWNVVNEHSERQAERRLACAMRFESVETDTFLARAIHRRISWPITYFLAHTTVTPNQVTLANTALGLLAAALLAATAYGWRVAGAALFVASIIIDGVDGELARVKMIESAAGERLDHFTDNLVHVAVFCGIALGVYRCEQTAGVPYALAALLVGFGLCAVAVNYASRRLDETANKDWLMKLERISGRDFAYLVLIFAVLDRLEYFVWGTALGTYAAALLFYGLAKVQGRLVDQQCARDSRREAAAEKSL
jgi:phosphatidylglycerophosphate synthase